jgi:hypothetical protein
MKIESRAGTTYESALRVAHREVGVSEPGVRSDEIKIDVHLLSGLATRGCPRSAEPQIHAGDGTLRSGVSELAERGGDSGHCEVVAHRRSPFLRLK